MKTGLTFSAAAHAALIILGLVGLNFGQPLQPEPVESISVDLVPVSEFSNIRKGTLDSTVIDTPSPSITESDKPAELAQPTGNTEQDQPTPERAPTPSPAPTRQTAPEAQPDPVPDPVTETAAPPAAAEPAAAPPAAAPPTPAPAPTPTPEPTPTPDPTPVAPTPELAASAPAAESAAPTAAPAQRTASLDQKRAEFKKQQEAAKAADAKAKADAEAKKVAEADAKKQAEADAKKAADAKAKTDADVKKVADAKKAADAKKKADEAKKAQQAANKPADDISDIINNEPSRGGTTGQGGSPTVGKPTGQASTLSNSQIAALGAQIKQCLNVPAGAQEAGLVVKLNFSVDASGAVVGNPTPVQQPASGLEQTYVSAATRAVLRCGPYTIAAGQDVRVTFDPNDY